MEQARVAEVAEAEFPVVRDDRRERLDEVYEVGGTSRPARPRGLADFRHLPDDLDVTGRSLAAFLASIVAVGC